ncbi:uncharacterized protein LOC133188844 isoform X2 [Saccostrea echinata]|uniref:uncharacterized protein LOC133188844 isoform X2 n=1 Tax=Saccostrea echinata TaxID=191078 RepID=UPI002A80B0F4|nr:uncharacterized protein LOC133188844 isoform X2 [Saccostrea echinata]
MKMHDKLLFFLCISFCVLVFVQGGMDFGSILNNALGFAEALGTSGSGEVDRGRGCTIHWKFNGKISGLKWKYAGKCSDSCTGLSAKSTTHSRDGAIEHCLRDLFDRLSARNEL